MAITNVQGIPIYSDFTTILDSLGSLLKGQYANIGIFGQNETTTLAGYGNTAKLKILGDGTTTYPGIANAKAQQILSPIIQQVFDGYRYDAVFARLAQVYSALDNIVRSNIPSDFSWIDATNNKRAFDLWLLRINAANSGVGAVPVTTPTVTAAAGGGLSQSGAIRIKFTHTFAYDWLESLPTAATTLSALTGKNGSATLAFSGTVPTGVRYINVYRQLPGAGSGDPYYFDQRIAQTAGASYTGGTMQKPDQLLNISFLPPAWLCCLALPEEAVMYALSLASVPNQDALKGGLMTFNSYSFFSPDNVALNPSNGYLGIGNQAGSGIFGQWVATAYTAGAIPTTTDSANVIQAFAGAANSIQARVTSVLNNNASITNVLYTYYDATNPLSGSAVSGTIAGPLTLNLASGSTVDLVVPAGRLVKTITGVTVGTATTGTFIFESLALRSI